MLGTRGHKNHYSDKHYLFIDKVTGVGGALEQHNLAVGSKHYWNLIVISLRNNVVAEGCQQPPLPDSPRPIAASLSGDVTLDALSTTGEFHCMSRKLHFHNLI